MKTQGQGRGESQENMKCSWKEASTLILTAFKKPPVSSKFNYELLALERSSKSSFMPNGYVFPGGTTEPADGDSVWVDLFSTFNVDISDGIKLNGKVPPILKNKEGSISKLLSLKITAIRETFEETGILLCKGKESTETSNWASYCLLQNLESWRTKVQKDAKEFFNMCQSYNCYPDVNSLYLWSNWLTPTSMGVKRFDTAFFIACMKEIPITVADKIEVEKLVWISPDESMELCERKKIWLPPPQVYETSRLLQFKDLNVLNNFAQNRCVHGCDRWMPIQIKTLDGSVSLLPGDDAYNVMDYSTPTKPKEVDTSNEDFRNQSKVLHRMEFIDKIRTKVFVKNYNATHEHVLPACDY